MLYSKVVGVVKKNKKETKPIIKVQNNICPAHIQYDVLVYRYNIVQCCISQPVSCNINSILMMQGDSI